MGVRRTRYLPESRPTFMPRRAERSKQMSSETSCYWIAQFHANSGSGVLSTACAIPQSIRIPPFRNGSLPSESTIATGCIAPAQIKSVLAVSNRSDWNRDAKPWIQNRDIAGIDKMGSDCAPTQSIQFATQIHHACGSVFRNRNWSATEEGNVVTPFAAESRNIERHERAGIIA